MAKRPYRSTRRPGPPGSSTDAAQRGQVRIIGGQLRGRRFSVPSFRSGRERLTRPMKDRVREAIYNLIGTEVAGRHAIDLFAGTGALGLEAVSRGASSALFIEQHVPTARILEENIEALAIQSQCRVLATSAFLWGKRNLAKAESGKRKAESGGEEQAKWFDRPWLVFCSPPYSFYADRPGAMLDLIGRIQQHAPEESCLVVETDRRFEMAQLPGGKIGNRWTAEWQVRVYPPAVVGVWRK